MPTCFVIQPFDGAKYDKRFEDIFAPAIKDGGLEPYRTDKDPSVDVPIEAIEEGIKASAVCLADITTDNPNVWYELGYAFALGKPVVMVCSDERIGRKYPFDIQHRTVTPYQAESSRDFDALRTAITKRVRALLSKAQTLKSLQEEQSIAPVQGLSQTELVVLAVTAGSLDTPNAAVAANLVKSDVEKSGFTRLAYSLGLRRLIEKAYLTLDSHSDYHGNVFDTITITDVGWRWIESNEEKFLLRREQKANARPAPGTDDDIPF